MTSYRNKAFVSCLAMSVIFHRILILEFGKLIFSHGDSWCPAVGYIIVCSGTFHVTCLISVALCGRLVSCIWTVHMLSLLHSFSRISVLTTFSFWVAVVHRDGLWSEWVALWVKLFKRSPFDRLCTLGLTFASHYNIVLFVWCWATPESCHLVIIDKQFA